MKLLLTSAGLTNQKITEALCDLVGKSAQDVSVAFIPTAANEIDEDKGWLIDNYKEFQEAGFKYVDILDIAVLPKEKWLPRLEKVDVICVGGGNELYLVNKIKKSGFDKEIEKLLKTKVYMGISAGSMVAGKFPTKEALHLVYPEEKFGDYMTEPMNLVDLSFIPHLNSEFFQHVRKDKLEAISDKLEKPMYSTDDLTALKVVDDEIEVVGEGTVVSLK